MFKGRQVYEWFIEGAKEGLNVCIRIFPCILAMIIAVEIFKKADLMNLVTGFLSPITNLIGLPKELIPLVIIKPLSGSGAIGVFTDIIKSFGPDTRTGLIASVIMGTTETIFYTITGLLWCCKSKEDKTYIVGSSFCRHYGYNSINISGKCISFIDVSIRCSCRYLLAPRARVSVAQTSARVSGVSTLATLS